MTSQGSSLLTTLFLPSRLLSISGQGTKFLGAGLLQMGTWQALLWMTCVGNKNRSGTWITHTPWFPSLIWGIHQFVPDPTAWPPLSRNCSTIWWVWSIFHGSTHCKLGTAFNYWHNWYNLGGSFSRTSARAGINIPWGWAVTRASGEAHCCWLACPFSSCLLQALHLHWLA